MTRLTDALDLREVGPTLLRALRPLCLAHGRFRELLRDRPEALIVAALDETGALGWAAAEASGLMGCFVSPGKRCRGIGRMLVEALWPAARRRWPSVRLYYQVRPGSPGERFWDGVAWALIDLAEARP